MSTTFKTLIFFLPFLLAFLIHQNQNLLAIIPQIIALTSLLIIIFLVFGHHLYLPLVIFIINLIVFSTGGITSPLFFLIYFLLFAFSFQNHPLINFTYSLIAIIFYSYSLNSPSSIIQLFSLLLITPLTYLISQQQAQKQKLESNLSQDETDFLFWISLKLKHSLREIISLSDNPQITKIAKNLLKNSDKLEKHIDESSDET